MNKIIGQLQGHINNIKIQPALEDLEITPSFEEQNFKSIRDGYDNIKVKGIETEERVVSSLDFGSSDTAEVEMDDKFLRKVIINKDPNLVPGNIKKDTIISGVTGLYTGLDVKITNAEELFYLGRRFDTHNELLRICEGVSTMKYMFYGCNTSTAGSNCELDLRGFDASNSTNMENMFYQATAFKTINMADIDASKVTNANQVFYGCTLLEKLDMSNVNLSSTQYIEKMFYNCSKLTELNLSNCDVSKAKYMSGIFSSCSALTDLKFFKNFGKGYTQKTTGYSNYTLDLTSISTLTYESVMDVINNIYDLNLTYGVADGGTLYRQKLLLHPYSKALLTEDEIAIATNKGWDVS